ncbi:MAG: precorrin-8X methylmutase [Syntrophales bacterium]|nr:precorrin-8X methylmutase [Syntrophales bacterium]
MNKEKALRSLVHNLYSNPMSGADIERRSFDIIDQEAQAHAFTPDQWQVVRRMIHTTGDLGIMASVGFSPDALEAAADALRACRPIYTDSQMIRSGISLGRLRAVAPQYEINSICCTIADEDVAAEAAATGLPRSIFAVRKAKEILHGGIAAFGNAPAALLELNRMITEEGIRPALVIAMPVGFVHVEESKSELTSLGIPYIVLEGRRGGSPLAVSVIHALCTIASQKRGKVTSSGHSTPDGKSRVDNRDSRLRENDGEEAVVLIGHGSRVPGAGGDMEQVAAGMRRMFPAMMIETCAMSLIGPHLPETLRKCISAGAKKIIVMPYFLYMGIHLREDIPKILREEGKLYPDVKLVLGRNLGFDPSLVDLVAKRLEESRGLDEIRNEDVDAGEQGI